MTMRQRIEETLRESAAGRWFDALSTRDRGVVVAIAVVFGLLFAYAFVWQPVHEWSADAQARHEEQRGLLEWMKANEQEARAAGRSPGGIVANAGSVLTLVANSAAESGIQLTRVQPESSGGVSVVLQNQPFSDVMRWLAVLAERHQITIRQVSIDRQPTAGLINARVNVS